MSADRAALTCPACGARIYPSDQQCLACGAKLDAGRLAGEPDRTEVSAPGPEAEVAPAPGHDTETAWPGAGTEAARAASGRAAPAAEVPYTTGAGPWHPDRVVGGRGLMDTLRRGWAFLRESVLMAFRDRDLVLPSLFAVLTTVVLLGGLALILYATGALERLSGDDEGLTPTGWAVLVAASFVAYLVTYFFAGMTVHLVDVHLRGQDARLGEACADCVRNFGGIALLALVSVVVSLLLSAVRGRRGGGVRGAAADAAGRAWMAATYLILPIMILEDSSFPAAAERATHLHRHNVLQIVTGEMSLMIATRILSGLVTAIAIAQLILAYFLAPTMLTVAIVGALLLFVLAAAFDAYVRTALYTCLYLWAMAMEAVDETVPAPAPLRPALQAAW